MSRFQKQRCRRRERERYLMRGTMNVFVGGKFLGTCDGIKVSIDSLKRWKR